MGTVNENGENKENNGNQDNLNNQENQDNRENAGPRILGKKTRVQKRGLSQFTIKIQSAGGVFTGGEISCVWTDKTQKFNDIGELIRFIEEQCDNVWYPQAQRKLRDWDTQH